MAFPTRPSTGDVYYHIDGKAYVYDGSKNAWSAMTSRSKSVTRQDCVNYLLLRWFSMHLGERLAVRFRYSNFLDWAVAKTDFLDGLPLVLKADLASLKQDLGNGDWSWLLAQPFSPEVLQEKANAAFRKPNRGYDWAI